MHDSSHASHHYYETALRRTFAEEVADVEPRYVLPQTVARGQYLARRQRRAEAWFLALVGTVGALLILIGLLLMWGQEQPADPSPVPSSTRPWEA